MKFLATFSGKDVMYQLLTPAAVREILPLMTAWLDDKIKAGIILEAYSVAGWNRSVFICQHDTAEDLDRTLRSMPGTEFYNTEYYPLADINETMKANMETAKAAEKYMPPPK